MDKVSAALLQFRAGARFAQDRLRLGWESELIRYQLHKMAVSEQFEAGAEHALETWRSRLIESALGCHRV